MSSSVDRELLAILSEVDRRGSQRKIYGMYPDDGPLRRELYRPHMKCFAAGRKSNIRAFMAGNRVGKSEGVGAYEVALHATGDYPDWWPGHRFEYAPVIWVAGKTTTKTRDTLQRKLLGELHNLGTEMIPGDRVDRKNMTMKSGTTLAVDKCYIEHTSGAKTVIVFKSFAEERASFESDEVDFLWLDEEPTPGVFGECVTRTISTRIDRDPGHVLCTFTPLEGMSEVVLGFMPDGKLAGPDGLFFGNRFVIGATWDDAPHLSKEEKERLWSEIPPYQREARTKGIPQLGSGAVYPIGEEDVLVDDFELPVWWEYSCGMDVGWNWTAAVWTAYDKQSDTLYLYNCYKRGKTEPAVHAEAIKSRGDWIPIVIDPASAGSSQKDGRSLFLEYGELLPNLYKADNGVEAGIFAVWKRISVGKLKVFRSCRPWLDEFRLYRRDDKGKIVKSNDHLMDCTRYDVMSGLNYAVPYPDEDAFDGFARPRGAVAGGGRSSVTGY